MTTYFLTYWCRTKYGSEYPVNQITQKHPVDWIVETREKYGENEEYVLLFWSEVPDTMMIYEDDF